MMTNTSFDQLMCVIRNNVHAYIENRLRDALSTTCDERGITYNELVNQIPSIKAFTESLDINIPSIEDPTPTVRKQSVVSNPIKLSNGTTKKVTPTPYKEDKAPENVYTNNDEVLRKRAIAAGKKKAVPSETCKPSMAIKIAPNSQSDSQFPNEDDDDDDESQSKPHKTKTTNDEPTLIKPNKRTSNKKTTSPVIKNNPEVMEAGQVKTKTTTIADSSQTQTQTQTKQKGKKMTGDEEVCICKGKTKAGKSCTFKCVKGAIFCKKHNSVTATTTTTTTIPMLNMCDLPSDEASWLADDDDDDDDDGNATNIGTATPVISMSKSFYPLSNSEKVYDDDEIFDDSNMAINSDVDPDEYILNE
jgi:hypothetical protein